VIVSNTPLVGRDGNLIGKIRNLPRGVTFAEPDPQNAFRGEKAYARIKALKDAGTPLHLFTNLFANLTFYVLKSPSFRYYPRVWVIKSQKTQKDSRTGDIVRMTIQLREIQFASSLRGEAFVEDEKPTDQGTKEPVNGQSKVPPQRSWFDNLAHDTGKSERPEGELPP
jgi:hypothetical protein